METPAPGEGLRIALLGELELAAPGRVLPLPPSKKTRALLGYLALTGKPHRRERLCELLWDVADDPRAALRWSLSKLRELLDGDGIARLCADREHVWLDLSKAQVDVVELAPLLANGLEAQPTSALEAARALFRGELLEGLDLPDFHVYYAWCVAERRLWRERHRQLLQILLARAGGHPDKALPLVRELVHLDPLDAEARAQLLTLLHATGKIREAEEQSRANRRLLTATPPEVGAAHAAEPMAEARGRRTQPHESAPFIARRAERDRIAAWLAAEPRGARLVLVAGDAGLGKSRLLRELARGAERVGARTVAVAVPEVHAGFSYAPWLELLRVLGFDDLDPSLREALLPLTSQSSANGPAALGREPLFQAAAALLERRAREAGWLVLVLDDVHWLDDDSAELLHYVARSLAGVRVDILLAARPGELHDQPLAARVLRTLRREGLLEELALDPLTREETYALIAELAEPERREPIYRKSAGNPLFALELAREGRSDGDELPQSISRLVRDRLAVLSPEQVDVLRWAAVLGSHFDVDLLAQLVSHAPEVLVDRLEELERRGWIALDAGPADGANLAGFAHEIVRSSVYDQLSEPRKRLMHAKVARLLCARSDANGPLAAVVAHHAALGGDRAMAARACLSAARRAVGTLAHGEAAALARRGLGYAADLAEPERVTLSIELLQVASNAREARPRDDVMAQLAELTARALDLGMVEHARIGFYQRACLMWENGRAADASRFSREAERISRLASVRERVLGLAEAARCAASLERDLPEAQAFVLEAEALAKQEGHAPMILRLACGLLALYRGDFEPARFELGLARELARRDGDRIEEFYALEGLVELELRRRDYAAASALAAELVALGQRLPSGSEAPLARGLSALCEYATNPAAGAAFESAVAELARVDAKQRRGLLLVRAAEIDAGRSAWQLAAERAGEALELARIMERASDAALALAVLVQATRALEGGARAAYVAALRDALAGPLSADACAAAERALRACGAGPEPADKGRKRGTRDRRKSAR